MPPSQRTGRASQSRLDDVDEYIEARQRRRARLAAVEGGRPERRRRDLMRAEFDWSDAPRRSRRHATAGLHSGDTGPLHSVETPGLAPGETASLDPEEDPAWGTDAGGAADENGLIDSAERFAETDRPVRRTIVITGRGGDVRLRSPRGYDARVAPHERSGFKPDRMAMWAVLLGLVLLLVAATSSHAAVLHAAAHLH